MARGFSKFLLKRPYFFFLAVFFFAVFFLAAFFLAMFVSFESVFLVNYFVFNFSDQHSIKSLTVKVLEIKKESSFFKKKLTSIFAIEFVTPKPTPSRCAPMRSCSVREFETWFVMVARRSINQQKISRNSAGFFQTQAVMPDALAVESILRVRHEVGHGPRHAIRFRHHP